LVEISCGHIASRKEPQLQYPMDERLRIMLELRSVSKLYAGIPAADNIMVATGCKR
jgi:hypothetical protein